MTKLSIILPTYNRVQWLPRSIGSVLNQSFRDWELVAVDDRSTDGSWELLQQYAERDDRIRYVPNQRAKGASGARNQGLDVAVGEFIAYLDSDDQWEPFHLAVMVQYLEEFSDQIDVMTADILRKSAETNEIWNYDRLDVSKLRGNRLRDGYLISIEQAVDLQLRGRAITTQTLVGKASALQNVRWDEELRTGEDCLHNLDVCLTGARVCHLPAYHVTYWSHGDNLSNCAGTKTAQELIEIVRPFAILNEKILAKPELSYEQRNFVKRRLASLLAWQLGYSCYEELDEFSAARDCYRRAIALDTANWRYWKAIAVSYVKQLLRMPARARSKKMAQQMVGIFVSMI
jgi:glycosyltransferase involved in cell wall biosynthesis